MPGETPVNYGFPAAAELDTALTQLIGKLDSYIGQRESDRRNLLGTAPCDKWSGKDRNTFESQFRKEQAELHALRESALRERGLVQEATTQARAAAASTRHGG